MEVCGTHTVSIFRSGIRSLLPAAISLLSGPGCPVCVTAQKEIDAFIALAREPETIVATFGDLIRVPAAAPRCSAKRPTAPMCASSTQPSTPWRWPARTRTNGWYSWGWALKPRHPPWPPPFGPPTSNNSATFSVVSAHKTVPPALEALADGEINIDGFLLPGHVSVIIGLDAYRPFF
jgi:hydrogenase expression/formation protein HypD